jgi:hypothetical protein
MQKGKNRNQVNFQQFVNKDGYAKGGVEVEVSNPTETQMEKVGGQKRMLKEKQRTAKWY